MFASASASSSTRTHASCPPTAAKCSGAKPYFASFWNACSSASPVTLASAPAASSARTHASCPLRVQRPVLLSRVCGVHVSASGEQQPHNVDMATVRCGYQRRPTLLRVSRVRSLRQCCRSRGPSAPDACGLAARRPHLLVFGVGGCAALQQQLHDRGAAKLGRHEQWWALVLRAKRSDGLLCASFVPASSQRTSSAFSALTSAPASSAARAASTSTSHAASNSSSRSLLVHAAASPVAAAEAFLAVSQ